MATAVTNAAFTKQAGASEKDYTAEGLRGVAALSVWFAHFFLAFFPLGFSVLYPGLQTSPAQDSSMEHFLRLPFFSAFWDGNFAVAIFFVLSGYVLSKPYYSGKGVETLRDRYLRRYFRLAIPIAVSVFIGFALMKMGALHTNEAAALTHSDWLRAFFNFPFTVRDALSDAIYGVLFRREFRFNPPLWTMQVEFIGSLIIFAFYALMPKGGLRKALHYAIALACLFSFTGADAIYYCAFLAGGLICAIRPPRAPWNWLLLLVGLALGGYQFDAFYSWLKAPAGYDAKVFYNAFGAFALLLSLRSGILDSLLASNIGRILGQLSFSIYLMHFFVLGAFSCWFFVRFSTIGPRWAVVSADFLLSSILLFAVAWIFERWVDRQGIHWSKKIVGYSRTE